MSGEIKVGDLVIVVRGCHYCGKADDVGRIFTVEWLDLCYANTMCCDKKLPPEICASTLTEEVAISLRDLKKIDPPAQNEAIETARESTLPA
jgi:hypothetical protein